MTKAELQLRWDELLIQARFFHMDMKLRALEENFRNSYGKFPREFDLLRAPPEHYQWGSLTVLLFICDNLPKIGAYCWTKTKADFDKVVAAVNKSNHNTHKNAAWRLTRGVEHRDLKGTSAYYGCARKEFAEVAEMFDSNKRNNQWAVCK